MSVPTLQAAIDAKDPFALRRILAENPAAGDELIHWGPDGKNTAHPLHYISDKFCDKTLSKDTALEMVDMLIAAGSKVDGLPGDNETPLHGAASLGAEDVGLRLIEAGANIRAIGSFARETPLHWAAHEGLDRLVKRLIEAGADLSAVDSKWSGTPLDWAEHGLKERRPDASGRHEKVIEILKNVTT